MAQVHVTPKRKLEELRKKEELEREGQRKEEQGKLLNLSDYRFKEEVVSETNHPENDIRPEALQQFAHETTEEMVAQAENPLLQKIEELENAVAQETFGMPETLSTDQIKNKIETDLTFHRVLVDTEMRMEISEAVNRVTQSRKAFASSKHKKRKQEPEHGRKDPDNAKEKSNNQDLNRPPVSKREEQRTATEEMRSGKRRADNLKAMRNPAPQEKRNMFRLDRERIRRNTGSFLKAS